MGRRWALAQVTIGVLALTACAGPRAVDTGDAVDGGQGAAAAAPLPSISPEEALRELHALRLVERVPDGIPEYARDAFGPSWADTDGNGCNQRDDVLLRDADPGTTRVGVQGGCDHDVLAGRWTDPYSGRALELDDLKDPSQAQAIQIDHVVPLAEAWLSGAASWSTQRRREYANDLDVLLAVDGPTNASKGSSDPAAWRPKKEFQCGYATRWISIKAKWRLGADQSEVAALTEQLAHC